MTADSLSVKLRQARGAMSLDDAATRSGVTAKRIRMYEQGERSPYGKTLRRLAEAYGVPVRELSEDGRDGGPPMPRAVGSPRRRRRRVGGQTGSGEAVEIPVQLGEGQTVRVVIELIIRQQPVTRADAIPGSPAATASPAPQEQPALPGRGEFGSESSPRQVKLDPAALQRLRRDPRGGPVRRPARQTPGSSESASSQETKATDPLNVFREAYLEFRRKK